MILNFADDGMVIKFYTSFEFSQNIVSPTQLEIECMLLFFVTDRYLCPVKKTQLKRRSTEDNADF